MRKETPLFDIASALDLMQKSTAQVLEQCKRFNAVLIMPHDFSRVDPDLTESLAEFDSSVSFHAVFECSDYQAQSFVSVNFSDDVAVECVISLGRPLNPERYSFEHEVLKTIIPSLEKTYRNGRVLEEKEQQTCVYTWKKDYRTLIGLVTYPPDSSTSTGVRLGIQIRDTLLHPAGKLFEELHEQAQGRVANPEYTNQWQKADNKAAGKSLEPKESSISKALFHVIMSLPKAVLIKVFPPLSYKGVINTQIGLYNKLKKRYPEVPENELLNYLIISRIETPPSATSKEEEYAHYEPLLQNPYKTLEDVIWAIVEYEFILSRKEHILDKLAKMGYTFTEALVAIEDNKAKFKNDVIESVEKKAKRRPFGQPAVSAESFLLYLMDQGIHTRAEFNKQGKTMMGYSEAIIGRALDNLVEAGVVEELERGVYCKVGSHLKESPAAEQTTEAKRILSILLEIERQRKKQSNTFGIWSLISGIIGIPTFIVPVAPIVAIVLSILQFRRHISKCSIAGLVLGIIGVALFAIVIKWLGYEVPYAVTA